MKKIKMIGKNYDVEITEGKKVCTVTSFDKNGKQLGRKDRIWNTFDYVVEDFKERGYINQ